MVFKMKKFSGFGNSPIKYEKDPKKFSKRISKQNKPTVKTEKQAFKEMSNEEKLEYYKSKKAKPTTGGRKSIKSSDLTGQQLKNIGQR
tara:strand:+ start:380 stop:643 length:264 start_codon:yes stop_codon:yes gene_type:complete